MRAKQLVKKLCDYCGKEFEASKHNVRYCSHICNSNAYKEAQRQKVIELTETLTKQKRTEQVQSELSNRPYLSIAETARLLGVCNKTAYNLAHSGKIKATRVSRRLTFVVRDSIDELLQTNISFEVLLTNKYQPIADWYTLDEITEQYGIKRHQIRKIINAENIPEKKDGVRTLIAKNKLDAYFKKKGFNEAITNFAEWYTVTEIKDKYKMTEQAIYVFVSRYTIPKKQQDGKRYYSKFHFDNIKNKGQ